MASKIKVGVIGVGSMGRHHTRVLSQLPEAELVGVSDLKYWRAKAASWRYGGKAFRDYRDLLAAVQAVVIAVPTAGHFPIGREALERGVHCLIEKPLARGVEEARELLRISEEKGLVLQVGHIERFNPAVLAATAHIRQPKFITVERLGPYDPRMANIGVVMDLMIHDLDILLTLVARPVLSLEALGAKLLSEHEDIANVRLRFEGGAVADVTASRVSLQKSRKMRIFQEDSYLSLDYLNTSLKIYRKKSPIVKSLSDIESVRPDFPKTEPLKNEHLHWLDCIRNEKKPWASAEHGMEALKLAVKVLEEIRRYDVAHPSAVA